ncbi:MAG: hypothetical protein GVY13_02100 [Alphaproteobacteria bacterium]|nr:hypothetical protein [Alphaproteobacteria bacterium]
MLPTIFSASKSIVHFSGWSLSAAGSGYLRFELPLLTGDDFQPELRLRGGAYAWLPDEHVTFEMIARRQEDGKRVPLIRLDWRPLDGGHTNPRRGPPKFAGKRIVGTHLHDFDLNWIAEENRMRGRNLPLAKPVPGLFSFEEVRDFVGMSFKIDNIGLVGVPPWG